MNAVLLADSGGAIGALVSVVFFVVGLGFFALSVLLDQEVLGISRGPFFEDTPKIIGICLWALWLMRSAIRLVRSQRDVAASEPAAV